MATRCGQIAGLSAARAIIANGEDKGKAAAAIPWDGPPGRPRPRRRRRSRPAPWSPASTGSGLRARSKPARRCRGKPSRSADSSSRNRRRQGRGRPASRPRAAGRLPTPAGREDRDRRGAGAGPHRDAEQRGRQHREQFADEDRVDRDRRGEDFDRPCSISPRSIATAACRRAGWSGGTGCAWPARAVLRAGARQRTRRTAGEGDERVARPSGVAGARGKAGLVDHEAKLADGRAFGVDRAGETRRCKPPIEHAQHWRVLCVRQQAVCTASRIGRGSKRARGDQRDVDERARRAAARVVEPGELGLGSSNTATTGCSASLAMRAPMPPKMTTMITGNSGPSRNRRNEREKTVAVKSRRPMTKAERISSRIIPPPPSRPIARAALSPAMATKASWSPGRSIASVSIPAPPSISALSKGSAPDLGQLESPFGAFAAGIRRDRGAPRPVLGAGLQADDRAKAVARLVDLALERDLAAGDDRDPLAQPLGVGDDMGRENDRRAGLGLAPDQRFELALVDRVEAARRVRRGRSGAACGRSCRAIARSAPCPSTARGPVSWSSRQGHARPSAASARRRPSLSGSPRKRAHEGNRFAAVHRRVEPALLGQIADFARGEDRPVAAEQAERPR